MLYFSRLGKNRSFSVFLFFFFNDTATTEIYTLSLHDALPILPVAAVGPVRPVGPVLPVGPVRRSEEHTSELQSHVNLVCRLLLEKKKKNTNATISKTKKKTKKNRESKKDNK